MCYSKFNPLGYGLVTPAKNVAVAIVVLGFKTKDPLDGDPNVHQHPVGDDSEDLQE